jgi:hypothetical protein
MRFVPVKEEAQQANAVVFRARDLLVQQRAQWPCHIAEGRHEEADIRHRFQAAVTAAVQCAIASALKVRRVEREMRWRCREKVLWTAACRLRNLCAEPADLNRCILRSRRRTI